MKRKLFLLLNAAIVLAILLLIWQTSIWLLHVPPYMLPSPLAVARAMATRLPDLATSFLISAEAAAMGLLASIAAGLFIALVFARSRFLRRMLLPYTILLQTVPIVAIAPLILMWAGQGLFAVALITFIICLAPLIANATQGLISVDPNLIQLFQMHNATQSQILRKLRLPHSLPYLFTGMRTRQASRSSAPSPASSSPAPPASARAALATRSSTPWPSSRPTTSSPSSSPPPSSASSSSSPSCSSSGSSSTNGTTPQPRHSSKPYRLIEACEAEPP